MPARDRSHPPDVAAEVDADADSDQGDLGPPPPTSSTVHVAELRLWKLEKGQRENRDLQREALDILREVAKYLGQLTDLERAREARVSLARLAVEKVGTLLERLSAPEALVHVATIARWGGVTAVALCAIVYGVGLSGYGFTIGSVGGLSGSVVAPVDDPPAPSPGQPVPSP
jgi:hypothetical protein